VNVATMAAWSEGNASAGWSVTDGSGAAAKQEREELMNK